VSTYGLDDGNIWVRLHEWSKILLLSTAVCTPHVTNTCCCTSQRSCVPSKCTFFPLHQSRLWKRALLRPSVLV